MDKKKIVFFIGSLNWGGAEKVTTVLAQTFLDKGFDVSIVTLLDDVNVFDTNPQINIISFARKQKRRISNIKYWIELIKKYLIKEMPDIAVSFVGRINLLVCYAKKKSKSKCRLIISERNDRRFDGRGKIEHLLSCIYYKHADLLICQTDIEANNAPKNMEDRTVVIPNPVFLTTKPVEFEQKQKIIITAGRLDPSKNHKLLIDAFHNILVKREDEGFNLHIYGNGSEQEKLLKLINEYGDSDRIKLLPSSKNVQKEMTRASIFCLPSNYEGMSNALMEALLLGTPSISTDVSGARDLIDVNKNGFIVPVGDVMQMETAIKQLIKSEELRKSFSNYCLSEEYQNRFSNSLNRYFLSIVGE